MSDTESEISDNDSQEQHIAVMSDSESEISDNDSQEQHIAEKSDTASKISNNDSQEQHIAEKWDTASKISNNDSQEQHIAEKSDTPSKISNNDSQEAAGIADAEYLNILLLGKSGIEHSTFINALANYLTYSHSQVAEEEELLVLVPTKFNIRDQNQQIEEITISYLEDENPFIETTQLNSKELEVYVFPIDGGQRIIRLIDTSTIKDAREVDEDKINFDDVVEYILKVQNLHAICFDFKSVPSKHAVLFQYSIAQILSSLDDSLSGKLFFIFSIDKNCSDDGNKRMFSIEDETNLKYSGKIPIFHVNNEAFKYFAAIKNGSLIDCSLKHCIMKGWDASAEQCKRLLDYIVKIPTDLQNMDILKKNIRDILQVYKPITDLSEVLSELAPSQKLSSTVAADIAEAIKETEEIVDMFPVEDHLSQSDREQLKNEDLKMSSDEESDHEIKLDETKYEKQEINLLLLGATGVGKSTFINSVANYLTYPDLKTAKSEKSLALIPTTFSVTNKNNKSCTVTVGSKDKNEFLETGVSATQGVKTYVFPICDGRVKVRLIDTPGMGDTRGIRQDDENSENILGYIGQLKELHAICFLFDPNQARQTVFFEYCMAQIFSRLDKSASRNIIFCFTKTRGSDYAGGETMRVLRKVFKDIKKRPPYVEIPLKRNVFCFDNEGFRYLAAVQHGVKMKGVVQKRSSESWKYSSNECWKLIKYILGDDKNPRLEPHRIQSTTAINEARRMIIHLCQPLAEISQLINHNMNILQRHEDNLQMENQSIQDLKDQLFIPVITLEIIEVPMPVTVCTSRKCSEVYQVGGRNKWHYKQRCHDPCYLDNVPKEVIGSPELLHCAAMSGTICRECDCNFQVHMHVYYMTETKKVKEKDPNVEQNINTKEECMENVRKLVEGMQRKKGELDTEHQIIITTCARFAHFLQNNAITPFSDSYKEYIQYLINQERSLGNLCNSETTDYLEKLLTEYEEIKASFDHALKLKANISSDITISPVEISESIKDLFKLKHNGKKIKELYECQERARKREYQNTEYVHPQTKRYYGNSLSKKKNLKDKVDAKNYSGASNGYNNGNYQSTPQPDMSRGNHNTYGQQQYSSQQPQIDQVLMKKLIVEVLGQLGFNRHNVASPGGVRSNPEVMWTNIEPRSTSSYGNPIPMSSHIEQRPISVHSEPRAMRSYADVISNPQNNYRSDYLQHGGNIDHQSGYLQNAHHNNNSGCPSFRSSSTEGPLDFDTYQQNQRDPFYYPPNSPFERRHSGNSSSKNVQVRDSNDQHQQAKSFWRRFF